LSVAATLHATLLLLPRLLIAAAFAPFHDDVFIDAACRLLYEAVLCRYAAISLDASLIMLLIIRMVIT